MTDIHECARRLTWSGGTHVFNLADQTVLGIIAGRRDIPLPTLLTMRGYGMGTKNILDGQFGDTVGAALQRFDQSVYSTTDIEHIILLGLIGARELPVQECVDLVDRYVVAKPLLPNAQTAYEILSGLFVGKPMTAEV